jgi:hypothetical protein
MSRADQVACEDVVMFVNAAIASTAQREFRSGAAAQRLSLEVLHEYVLGNYRDLYAATLALDVNHLNAQRRSTPRLGGSRRLTYQRSSTGIGFLVFEPGRGLSGAVAEEASDLGGRRSSVVVVNGPVPSHGCLHGG